jgi:acetolactate synthase-1/2/3 large subunit
MMLNLQELQTIAHHQLPVKIIVFSNDGYLMLKHTQKAQGMMYAGVDKMSGLSCPSYRKLAYALDIPACDIHSWADAKTAIPQLFAEKGPALVEFFMDPEQPLVPKLGYQMKDGQPVYAQLDELSP